MTTYREFQAELEVLHQKSRRARREEVATVIARIQALIDEYDITEEELGLAPRRSPGSVVAAAKYRDPQTGATWSGRGRPPRWLDGQDRAGYLIER